MHCALPPFEPLDGVLQRHLALVIIGGVRPRGDRHLSAIARLQGFSSCSPAAFPHQWAVWWGKASRAEAEERTEWGVASAWVGNPFLPQRLGEKGILQPCGGVLQPCGGRRTAAPWTGCSFPSFVRAAVVPRTGRPRPGLPRTVSRAGGFPSTSYAARAVLVFWGGLGEDRSEGLPVRFGAAVVRRCGVGGFKPTVGALRLFSLNGLSSPLVWGRGRGPLHNSVCPEAVAAAIWPPEAEVVVAVGVVAIGEPPGVCYPTDPLV
jgi:hypothetical protein